MVLLLALVVACTGSTPSDKSSSDSGGTATDSTPCADDTGLAPQPSHDYLSDYAPVVVKTVPQAGDQAVDPSLTEIRVTFSADMQDEAWSWVQDSADTYPQTTGDPYYEHSRTNVLPVQLEPDHTYVIWLNSANYQNFQDKNGNTAVPYQLAFHTAPE
jgi:hypothetical protein